MPVYVPAFTVWLGNVKFSTCDVRQQLCCRSVDNVLFVVLYAIWLILACKLQAISNPCYGTACLWECLRRQTVSSSCHLGLQRSDADRLPACTYCGCVTLPCACAVRSRSIKSSTWQDNRSHLPGNSEFVRILLPCCSFIMSVVVW